jgi:hypothetical protein
MTSIQLSYRLYQESALMWLAGLNTRRLKVNLPLIAAFMAGLLWTRGRASCNAIATGGAFAHDALNRLLKTQSLRALLQMAALTLVDKSGGYLIIDDVVWAKRGKLIEGVVKLFMPSEKRYVFGLNVVVLAWSNGRGLIVPLTFRFWKPAKWYTDKEQSYFAFDDTPFRTKIELAVEMLDWAHAKGIKPIAVLFDAAYLAKPVLKYLKKRKWHWVSRVKGNRVLHLAGKKLKPKDWEAEHAAGRLVGLNKSLLVTLNGWGAVRVIAAFSSAPIPTGAEDGSIGSMATGGASSTPSFETASNSAASVIANAESSKPRKITSPLACSRSFSSPIRPDAPNRLVTRSGG